MARPCSPSLAGALRWSWFTLMLRLLAVPIAWSVLAARGRWRTGSGWIDAFGKAIGVGWCLVPWVILARFLWFTGGLGLMLKLRWF